MAPARCRRSHGHWRGGRGGSGLITRINNNRREKRKDERKNYINNKNNVKRKNKKRSKVRSGIRATIAARLFEAPRVRSRAAPSSASRPAALTDKQERGGEGGRVKLWPRRGWGEGGRTPSSPGVPATPPVPGAGGQPGGSQPDVGRQRSIVKASQRLNHLMIQKSMGKGEGRAKGVASRRPAAAPPFPASSSDSAGGGKRSHSGARSTRDSAGAAPEPAVPSAPRPAAGAPRPLRGGNGGNGEKS